MKNFVSRHIGTNSEQITEMVKEIGYNHLDQLIKDTIPENLLIKDFLKLPQPKTETDVLSHLKEIASKNKVFRSFIGMGYYSSILPSVIQRNILENPAWYTAYTPYQAEIAQGRLEALLNFQTMINDLTGMEISNASLLDEGTAAAEAMLMLWNLFGNEKKNVFFVSQECYLQTIQVVQNRAEPLGIKVKVAKHQEVEITENFFGALIQYPSTDGFIYDYSEFIQSLKSHHCFSIVAADLLSLTLLKPPGEFDADVVVGSTQRFGLSLGYGGPHSAYFATKDQYKRNIPGRLVGVSKDSNGNPAYRLALQTREQHIRKEKATSNICTSQVLLAVLSSMYAVYHGPKGLQKIAKRIHSWTNCLSNELKKLNVNIENESFFDTLKISTKNLTSDEIINRALKKKINLRRIDNTFVGISLDETTTKKDIIDLLSLFFNNQIKIQSDLTRYVFQLKRFSDHLIGIQFEENLNSIPNHLQRKTKFLTHPVFHSHQTETKMLRYIRKLEARDLSLVHSMIPLGSCTMKLNGTTEMIPISWKEFSSLHPFAPQEQTVGYKKIFEDLETWLSEITGLAAVSFQPNSGSQGEYAGLLCIRSYLQSKNELDRNVCFIPESAHGTNFASAVMIGFKIVVIRCDENGNISLNDLEEKMKVHKKNLAALMVTYPSTHGVFETSIQKICEIVHENGGQVYMDGANMTAMIGLCLPAQFGIDVCHLNLHKTFCIPHGGGGPGVGPICVAEHLKPFLPGHFLFQNSKNVVSSAPWGSANILLISWAYILMMGNQGLSQATKVAILNANYIAKKLPKSFPVLYTNEKGLVAHECIVDFRSFKKIVDIEDIAKRLIDFGFHAPTMSWPVPGTLMIEPTESESKEELDRFIAALSKIDEEIQKVLSGEFDPKDNPLKNAPHTIQMISDDQWNHRYTRKEAAYPLDFLLENKFWSSVGRIDNVHGDRNLFCSCPSVENYE